MKKNKRLGWIIASAVLTALLASSILYATVPAIKNWTNNLVDTIITRPSEEDPSSELPSSEVPGTIDLSVVNRYKFNAINSTVTLTATVTPANASDKTIVWTTSDSAKVSITGTTATTATIKCLAAFNDTVVITARATNGTVTEDDDFVATCAVTYLVPIQTIDLQYVTVGPNSFAVGAKINVKVVFTPANANEDYDLSFNGAYLQNNGSYFDLGYTLTEEAKHSYEFEVVAATPAKTTTPIAVSTDVNDLSDTLAVYCGYHLGVDGRTLQNITVDITTPTNATFTYDLNDFDDALTYNSPFAVGTKFKINLPAADWVQPAMRVTYSNVLQFTSSTGTGVTNTSAGIVDFTGVGAATVTLTLISDSAVTEQFAVIPTNYAGQGVTFSFMCRQPITGISLDNTNVVF